MTFIVGAIAILSIVVVALVIAVVIAHVRIGDLQEFVRFTEERRDRERNGLK
jgi:hypothetical protein